MSVGQTTQLAVTLRDGAGIVLNGRTVSWSSSNPAAAAVSSQGLVTAVAKGSATITATSEGKTGSADVTTTNVAVGSVTIQPQGPSVVVGSSVQLGAIVRDANGSIVTDRAVTWSSSNAAVATIVVRRRDGCRRRERLDYGDERGKIRNHDCDRHSRGRRKRDGVAGDGEHARRIDDDARGHRIRTEPS